MTVVLELASARTQIADYLSIVIRVYTILIFAYILSSMYFSVGGKIPYSRWSRAILDFLRDVCEPYLKIFRRFIPSIGMFDFSPMIAIIVLYFVRALVVSVIQG